MELYLVYNSRSEAEAVNSRINFDLAQFWSDGITNNYCEIKEHPTENKFAVIIDPAYSEYFTATEITQSVELTADWTPIQTI